MDTLTGGLTS